MSACLRFTRRVWQSFITTKGHDAQCFPNLVVHRAVPGEVNATLKIENYNLHGGLILSMTDTLGSLAVASRGYWMTGVSTDIGTSFVRPAGRPGDVLHVKAVLTALGKSLAYTRVDFTNPAGELVAYGYHTKYVGKSSTHQKNVKLSEDGEQVLEGEDIDID
ncbi:thioesterase thiol ester dehydrase-isomerase [Lentinula edodes]|uniref:thioesterase thiol ester dehydrase-isomerase n=1 Tax=Lentinula edodes TaxID=5353 RepID=UPI001E8DCBFE|nr:thioesterase thiol ester dehydrase-isomerase [Lentinula edodes]KAH7878026.1 thioesterase thiol ester dehydrase-isomerase [Lentinula edodes]KAJ3910501.1 thioesterase thiol ester dehydrase-isomerase [Lentinula edodes]KAJ3920468.1 thioesterase thiol ester dehydrase-isomerase [Lentinula edodes]